MSEDEIQDERIKVLGERVDKIEAKQDAALAAQTNLLVELKVLQTRVTLYAGTISVVSSALISILVKHFS